ncbi:S41 family peptidase [Candidatus Saccharibacteria bacterium]|nr:S41 family peptidase [Candidatus Saccharibacteria bacterium]
MRQYKEQIDGVRSRRSWKQRVVSVTTAVIIGTGLFVLGWAGGSGAIAFPGRNVASQNQDLPKSLDYSSVDEVYKILRQNYDGKLDTKALLDGLKSGLAASTGDPYTEYFNEEQAEEFNDDLNGTFSGIGAELSREEDLIVIVSPIQGYPAQKAGLKPKDIIVEINGEQTYGMTLTEAVRKIRGESGTNVTLKIVREGESQKDYTITREDITIPSVESEMKEGSVGYIQISRFADDTASLTQKAAQDLKSQGAKAIVLDMRGNPGGRLDAAVDVSSLWLNKSQTVLEERRGGVAIKTYKANGNPILAGLPTVVLIDEGSASASEIVAGALQDNKVATLIGVTSFGKGSVQGLENIPSGGILKVTIARWYTPSGNNIDKEGIKPDKEVKITDEQIEAEKDPQIDAALEYLKK